MKIIFGEEVHQYVASESLVGTDGLRGQSNSHGGSKFDDVLCSNQSRIHRAGYRAAELCKSMYGWSLRSASGLDGFSLISPSQSGMSYNEAIDYAKSWQQECPSKRYVFCREALS